MCTIPWLHSLLGPFQSLQFKKETTKGTKKEEEEEEMWTGEKT